MWFLQRWYAENYPEDREDETCTPLEGKEQDRDENFPKRVVDSIPRKELIGIGNNEIKGHKKAVIVGINYTGTNEQLHGCVNDAQRMFNNLIDNFDYKPQDIVILTDEQVISYGARAARPTCENIMGALVEMVVEARKGDRLFFSYSGHGDVFKDLEGNSATGNKEAICPVDYGEKGLISSDDLYHIAMNVPHGVKMTIITDSCFTGTFNVESNKLVIFVKKSD